MACFFSFRLALAGRAVAIVGVAGALMAAITAPVQAADWPTHAVTVIVPFPPGGNTDTMARLLAQKLSDKFGQPFVVDNRAGASGAIGTSFVARATPNGYTLLFGAVQQVSVIPYTEHVNYDPAKDLTPISIFGEGPFALGINTAAIPAKTLQEFISYAKTKPGELSYASAGVGSLTHLAGALFAEKAGLKMIHVPYRGGGPAVADLLGGHVQAYFGNASELMPFAKDDRVRIIAVSTATRMAQLPEVATVAELFPGFKLTSWNGLIGPGKMPDDIVEKVAKATIEAAHDPVVMKTLTDLGIAPIGNTPAQFRETIEKERPLLAEAIKAADLPAP